MNTRDRTNDRALTARVEREGAVARALLQIVESRFSDTTPRSAHMSLPRYRFASSPIFSSCVAVIAVFHTVACSGDGGSTEGGSDDGGVSGSPDAATGDARVGNPGTPGHDASDDASSSGGLPFGDAAFGDAGTSSGLNPNVAPGGNFDLSLWELQEPVGAPGSPTTLLPAQLEGANGYHDKYFFTDPTDGSMTFWDPESGVTTPNSNYPRSELREMNSNGVAANWLAAGHHTLSATLKATVIPSHVAVGQIHLGTGTPASTKPLLELFYFADGTIVLAIEQTPAGGNEVQHPVGTVPLGTKWSYVIGLSGNTISLVLNGGAPQTFTMSPTFAQEGMFFKAGNYDQSVGADPNVSSTVQFYALSIAHSP